MADNKAFQKKANIALVMQTIRVKKEISRIDISRELGLDRSTITNIVTKLIESELLIELSEGLSESKGGRKPVLLGINKNFGLVLGLEIQVNLYRATLVSLDGTIIWNRVGENEGSDLIKIFSNILTTLESDISKESLPLLGIGIGLPGHIDPIGGKILNSSPFYREESYHKDFIKCIDVPVILDNDANCCAWGVLEDRKESHIKNFIYALLELQSKDVNNTSKEIGFGIVVNGEVYYGNNFAAGELLHALVPDDELSSEFNFEEYFKKLTKQLSLFISFLNPSHLYLGGEFINHKPIIMKLIKESKIDIKCEILFSNRQEFDISFGAGSMFLERLFKIPGLDSNKPSELTWERILSLRTRKS